MALSWTNSADVMTADDAGPSSLKSANSETKRKGFHPLRAVRRIFRRKSKQSTKHDERVDPSSMVSLKSRSTSELLGADDEDRNRPSNGSNNLGSGLSMSHDSVFSPEHNSEDDIRNAHSIQNLAMQELMDRLHPPHDSDEDDAGLPHSPCTSPTTAEVLRQGLREASGKSRSTCSDGSLLSMGSSETDEDSLMQSSRQLKMPSERHDVDSEDGAAFPLSHKAAHHKISVRPKRTHAVGRHRKLQQQLTVASLPATPEDIEEMRVVSPDRSWHSVGDREATGSSGSASRASSVMSTSDSTGSLSTSASPTRKKVLPTPQEMEGSIRARASGTDWKLVKQDESLGRRRTFSESPHREQEARERELAEMEARRDKVQSLSMVEGKEMHAAVMSWGQQETKKETRNVSPNRKDIGATPQQASPVRRAHSSLSSRDDDGLIRAASPVRVVSMGTPVLPSTSPELKASRTTALQMTPPTSVVQNAKVGEVEGGNDVRRSIKRDPSYRVAVHESPQWNEFNENVVDKPKKEESSSSKFSFGSKNKKSVDVPPKDKGKEKKEEKAKKEEKKVDDSPFFSRFWGSRRSNKKKKDKKDDELESDSTTGYESEEKDASTEPLMRRQSDFPTSGSVDVKAMIQNITARSSFTGTGSGRSKDQEFLEGKPARPLKPKSMCVGSASSKSMESLGPKSLDTVVPVDLDSGTSSRTHLSGSMPRLNSSPLKVQQIRVDDKEESPPPEVMMIEGEIVRLRKKVFTGEDPKTKSTLDQQSTPAPAEQKRNSKRSSILAWYNNKKESTPTPVVKPVEKGDIPVPSERAAAPRSTSSFSGRLWSSKKDDTKPVVNGKSPPKSVTKTPEPVIKQKPEKRSSIPKVTTDVKPEISVSKKMAETPRKNSRVIETNTTTATPSPDKAQRPETIRLQSVYQTQESIGKMSVSDASSDKRRPSFGQGPTSPMDKIPSQIEAKNVDIIIKPQSGASSSDTNGVIVNLDSSPRSSVQKSNVKREIKQEMLDKGGDVSQNGDAGSKFVRGSAAKEGNGGESELMKVFHRRSLKVKDKEPTTQPVVAEDVKDEIKPEIKPEVKPEIRETPSTPTSATSQNSEETSPLEKSARGGGMTNKKSKSLCLETAPVSTPRMRTTSSPGTSAAIIDSVAKNGDRNEDGSMPEWRRIAQKRREQREQREKQHVTGNGHADPAIMLQATPKHSGRSKVLDMVSNFQKLQVS